MPPNDHALYRLRRLHCAMETMIIRSLTEGIITKKSPSFLKCSDHAKNVGYAIIRAFLPKPLNLEPVFDDREMLILKHKLFIEVFKGHQRTASMVGEVSEQALLALSLLPSGDWMKAGTIRNYVCFGLWSFRATFANWARVNGSDYYSFDRRRFRGMVDRPSEEVTHYQAPTDADPGDVAPEVPEALEEDDESDEEDMERVLVQGLESVQLQSSDEESLLQTLSVLLKIHLSDSESEDGDSVPVDIDE